MKKIIACILIVFAFFLGSRSNDFKQKPIVIKEEVLNYEIDTTKLIFEINEMREKYNVPPVARHKLLMRSAQMKAEDMIKFNYWDHYNPNGTSTPWTFFKWVGYDYQYAGENLAKNFFVEERESVIVEAWLNSPRHKEVMLSRNYIDIGVGYKQWVVVCHYGIER